MQKTIAIIAIACLLIVFPVTYFICQPTEAGIGDKITVSQRLVARDNCISDGDIVQESAVRTGGANPGVPDANSDEDSEENPGGDQGDGSNSGDDSGDNSGGDSDGGDDVVPGGGDDSDQSGGSDDGSKGPSDEASDESPGDETGITEVTSEGPISGNPVDAVVINEVHPAQEIAFENRDEMVELYNMGRNPVNVSMWYMKNMTGQVIGTIRDKHILPHEFLVVEVNGLKGDSQRVALFDSRNNKVDSVIYIGARSHSGLCYARMPDGANNWEWAACTLGSSNQQGNPG